MFRDLYFSIRNWVISVVEYVEYQWDHLTPQKYLFLLIMVAFIGWVLMKNQSKK